MNPPGLVQRVAGAALGVVLFIAAVVFASVILAIAAAFAFLLWVWFLWRRRDLPKRSRGGGVVIEGEYRVEPESPRHLGDKDSELPQR